MLSDNKDIDKITESALENSSKNWRLYHKFRHLNTWFYDND